MMKNDEQTNIKRCIIRSIKLIQHENTFFLTLSFFVTIVLNILPIASLLIMQSIVNHIQINLGGVGIQTIAVLIVWYIAVDIFQSILQAFWQQYKQQFSLRFKLQIEVTIQSKLKQMRLEDYENSDIYNDLQLARVQGSGQILDYISLFTQFIGSLTGVITHVFLLTTFHWWVIAVVLLLPLIKYTITNKFNKEQYEITKARTTEARKTWYWDFLMTSGQNFKELTTYQLYDYFIDMYKEKILQFNKQDINLLKRRTFTLTLLTITQLLLNGLLFGFVVFAGYIGDILIGNIVTYTRAIMSTQNGIDSALINMSQIRQSSFYIDLFFKFMDLPTKNINSNINKTIDTIKTIEVRNLSFQYHGKNNYAIKNLSFTIYKNDIFVIVGENGSGKTTLAKLLMGFYDEYEGEILINGIELREIDKEKYLSAIGAVFQDFVKYEATVRENIAFGNLHMLNNNDKLKHVLRNFQNDALSIDTQVGNWFDKGTQISTGQWQKLALCRAFVKNADLYILDEPNASLDPISEYEIAQLYTQLMQNKIGIIIAHKFNNITLFADNILVMEEGKIKEQGNHKKLLEDKGRYYELFMLQSGEKRTVKCDKIL